MGVIRNEVYERYLNKHLGEESMLTPFLPMFDVTHGQAFTAYRTIVSIYFLRPSEQAITIFGFDKEILLIYVPHSGFEGRVTQLVDQCMNSHPASGRVDNLCYVLVSDERKIRELVTSELTSSAQIKSIIPFYRGELNKQLDAWFVRRRISESLFSRDLFDVTQPLVDDIFYFGRNQFITDLIDRLKRGNNASLFGLRKLGKTSTIFNIQNRIKLMRIGHTVFINGTDTQIYEKRWWELLNEILIKVSHSTNHSLSSDLQILEEKNASQIFGNAMNYLLSKIEGQCIIIIDEIEHISPETCKLAKHWNSDFLPFWQSVRAYQTTCNRISFLLVGVNPKSVDTTSFDGVDNPIFGLIPSLFLPPFKEKEVRDMVRTLSKYMGMKFTEECYAYLQERYGGHPMLIRLSCSWIYKYLLDIGENIPLYINLDLMRSTEFNRDQHLVPWARHIVEVLANWYPEEYELLELLCLDLVAEYNEKITVDPERHKHLIGYGLVEPGDNPNVKIAVVKDYMVRNANKKREENNKFRNEESEDANSTWSVDYEKMLDTLTHTRAFCIDMAKTLQLEPVFEDNKTRISAKVADLRVTALSNSRQQFENAINTLNQVFVESITIKRDKLQLTYNKLFVVTEKIRCLRHYFHHSELNDSNVKKIAIQTLLSVTGGFPDGRKDWEKLHHTLVNDLVSGLQELQQSMIAKLS